MSARVEKLPDGNVKTERVIVGFDAQKLRAPFLLRCGAILIDYILLISIPVASLLIGRSFGNDGSKLLNSEISNVGWLIFLLLALTNFLIFPMFSGQSIGKMITGIRIVKSDGSAPGFASIILRNVVGYPLTLLSGGLGFLIAAFSESGRAVHDYLGNTVVVYAERKVTKKRLIRKPKTTRPKGVTLGKKVETR